ncbi:MAG TPA: cytochrome c [Candidatus Acidoferrales bacterium]|nr:cytochrome c [Candidatus Acidoferrales bacterium]
MSRRLALLPLAFCLAGCRGDMLKQPRFRPLDRSEFFADGRSARPIPAGTVEFNEPDSSDTLATGKANGTFAASIPVVVDEARLQRGRERFNIYCSPCHGMTGDGHGMIAERGFLQPADLHSQRVRSAPPGYIYAVIANGYGSMPDYRDQLSVEDRWAVVAYIRALELSRGATIAEVPPEQRPALENAK